MVQLPKRPIASDQKFETLNEDTGGVLRQEFITSRAGSPRALDKNGENHMQHQLLAGSRGTKLATGPGLLGGGRIFILALASLGFCPSAHAAAYTVLYSFHGKPSDGFGATGSLVLDRDGNLYGTTAAGGSYNFGTVFKIDSAGNETVLTNVDYANGNVPQPGLTRRGKIFYDTVSFGGYSNAGGVVRINRLGKATLLYNFCSLAHCADGANPGYGVTSDNAGNLYGKTAAGGAYSAGVVFKVDSGGGETVLYSFCPDGGSCDDGASGNPSGVVRDSGGNLYGTAAAGPYGYGVVWKLDPSGKESVLHAFAGPPSDGSGPIGLLTSDGAGNLYGVTIGGGSGTACAGGCGTVFKINANGNETVLYNFVGGADGANPNDQALVLDKKGNLYGTARNGGADGYGTVFKLNTSGKLKTLYSFQGQSDGKWPLSGLLLHKGVIYGEAAQGGDLNCSENPGGGCGVVFKITLP